MATTISTTPDLVESDESTSLVNAENTLIITDMDEPAQIQAPGKHQMLPVVYIQTPNKKTIIKKLNTPILPKSTNVYTIPNMATQSLLIGKQPILLTKPPNLQPIQKNGITYLTMVNRKSDTNLLTTTRAVTAINKNNETVHVIATSNPHTNTTQKYILAPMPKVTGNRLPVTATTNSVQPKISYMPLQTQSKSKVYNFKIADGQIQSETNEGITILCEGNNEDITIAPTHHQKESNNKLYCNEIIEVNDKGYQLSIVEDSNSINDGGFTFNSLNDEEDDDNKKQINNLRDAPKFSKHGVSILKKAYSFLDRKDKPKPTLSFKSITTISDTNTKEVKISQEVPVKKNERRRKSTICLRKDYDDVAIMIEDEERPKKIPKLEILFNGIASMRAPPIVPKVEEELEIKEEIIEMDELDIKTEEIDTTTTTNIKMHEDDYDVAKLLTWDDKIGTLPGSDLKFRMNEFGFLEYLTKDEYRTMIYRNKMKENERKRSEELKEMRCMECGCFGMPSEFISPKYCGVDCQTKGENKALKKKKYFTKTWFKKRKSSDEESSNENSQEQFQYPWHCAKRGFSWVKYLEHIKGKRAPLAVFNKDPFPYNRNGFRVGMKLEGIDPQHPSYFCVLSVNEIAGYRLRLHFDGYSQNYDFWVNADSMDIFQAGFSEKYGHTLTPPPGYENTFNWNSYLKEVHGPAAPKHLFANRITKNAIYPNGFRTGMKLEAVDRKNTSLICVATIRDMMDNRILIHFDSWDDIYDYWVEPTSPYIHPVCWCDKHGHDLTPPNGYPNPETFTWEKYLKETKSVAAPSRAFKSRPVNNFKKGMRLECVDKRHPLLIRVATVDDVRDHQIRVVFDGWPDRYGYWVEDDSPDIHPVGWCQKTSHRIEPPLTPDDVYDVSYCPTVGCRGLGHILGPALQNHSTAKTCPYSDENIFRDKILPDRLAGPETEAAVPISRQPREKSKHYPNKYDIEATKVEWSEDVNPSKRDCKIKLRTERKKLLLSEDVNLEEISMFEKHSKYLNDYVSNEVDPCEWTINEVANFVSSLPNCINNGELFNKNRIDGNSFLMLTQNDLVELLNFKLGPAITLYNCILILRKDSLCT